MRMHAYSELYLDDAKRHLGDAFDYAINVCKVDADDFVSYFVESGIADLFGTGNPIYVSGQSGIELARNILEKVNKMTVFPPPIYTKGYSKEYWAGWSLAEYQWYSGHTFKEIFDKIPLSSIIKMYHPYHEMDVARFNEALNQFFC